MARDTLTDRGSVGRLARPYSEIVDETPPSPVAGASWHADRRLTVIKFVLAAVFAGGPFAVGATATSRLLGLVVGVGMAVWGARDLVAPVRLTADAAGVTVVTGFAGRRRLSWSDVERVRLDARSHCGARSELLEIDCGESLYFFSRYDLSEPPADALDTINQIRAS